MSRQRRGGRARVPWPWALAAAASTWLVVACGPYEVEAHDQLGALAHESYPLVFLAPPQLLIDHEPYQSYQYGTELAAFLSEEGRIPVATAWEISIEGEHDGDISTDLLMSLLDESDASVTEVLLLSLTVEEAMTARSVQAPLMMGGGTEHHYQSDVTVRLTAHTATYREEVAAIVVDFEDPPFAEGATAGNPRPVLREAIREAGRALIERFEQAFPAAPAGRPPALALLYNPRDLFEYRETGEDSLASQLEGLDELDRLASQLVYYQFFEPDLDGSQLRLFESSPPGLLVETVEADDSELRAGDYIVAVEGRRVAGWHTFWRAFLRGEPGASVHLTVTRDGAERVVSQRIDAFSD